MRNSKKTQLLIVAVVGIILFSFIPAVQGSQGHGTIKRSLDDWFYVVDGSDLNPHILAWASDTLSEPVIMYPHFDAGWNLVPIWECDYTGFVHDREMSDGRHMITVHMRVKGVPVIVETFDPENYKTLFIGEMDYIYVQKFIVNITEWSNWLVMLGIDDDGFTDDGNILLPRQDIPMVYGSMFGFEFVSILVIGGGKGTAVSEWNGLEPGDSAKTKIGQYGVANEGSIDWKIDFIKVY
jgi:hypothetical protein